MRPGHIIGATQLNYPSSDAVADRVAYLIRAEIIERIGDSGIRLTELGVRENSILSGRSTAHRHGWIDPAARYAAQSQPQTGDTP